LTVVVPERGRIHWRWGTEKEFAVPRGILSRVAVGLACAVAAVTSISAAGSARPASASTPAPGLQAWGWGFDASDTLRNGLGAEFLGPVNSLPVVPGLGYRSVALGEDFGVGILSDGSTWEWGTWGLGGLPRRVRFPQPGVRLRSIVAGYGWVLGLDTSGKVWGWGHNDEGELGDGDRLGRGGPVRTHLPPSVTIARLATGGISALAVGTGGHLWTWGAGRVTAAQVTGWPTPAPRLVSAAVGIGFDLARASDGRVFAWGDNEHGQLGDGTTTPHDAPARVHLPAGVDAISIAAGGSGYAVDRSGRGWAWGGNGEGQLGLGFASSNDQLTPAAMAMPPGVSFTHVVAVADRAAALGTGGTAWGWGRGPTGDGSMDGHDRPTEWRMPTGVVFSSIRAGGYYGEEPMMSLGTGSAPPDATISYLGAGPAQAGQDAQADIDVGDSGGPSQQVTVTYRLPLGVTFVAATPTQGTCAQAAGLVTCELGTVGVAAGVHVQFHNVVPGTSSDTVATVLPGAGGPGDVVELPYTILTNDRSRYVGVGDDGFDRRGAQLNIGRLVDWYFHGEQPDGVRDASGLGLFDSGTRTPIDDFQYAFGAAGTYPVADQHGRSMRVGVRMDSWPHSRPTSGSVFVSWQSWRVAPQDVHDVQVAYCAATPCSPAYQVWKTGVIVPSGSFDASDPAWQGPGTYFFRARLRDAVSGAASGWSPALQIPFGS
jgi:Regulator of chromosome condensation (RCC1) repeat